MPLLDGIERAIFASRRWRFLAVVLTIALVKSGVWIMPNLGNTFRISLNPLVDPLPLPSDDYLFEPWLGPLNGWRLHTTQ